jgi:hypothetical protein
MAAAGAIAAVCYLNSLEGPLIFDDKVAILKNPDVTKKTSLYNVFSNDFWGEKLTSFHSHKSYRPMTVLSFRLNVDLMGSLSPWGFHFGNLLLHAATSALLVPVYLPMLKQDLQASLAAACYFASHPVHTDAVASAVGRADVLCGFFVLLALLSYRQSSQAILRNGTGWPWLVLSLALTLLAMLSKEQGVTVLALCVAFDLLFVYGLDFKILFDFCQAEGKKVDANDKALQTLLPGLTTTSGGTLKAQLRLLSMRLGVMVAAMVVFVGGRIALNGTASIHIFTQPDNPAAFAPTVRTRLLTYWFYWWNDAWLLIFPFAPKSCDWSNDSLPLVEQLSDHRLLGPLALFALVIWAAAAAFGLISSPQRADDADGAAWRRALVMALAMAIVPFLPALVVTVGFVVAERVLYIPSMGACLGLGMLVAWPPAPIAALANILAPALAMQQQYQPGKGKHGKHGKGGSSMRNTAIPPVRMLTLGVAALLVCASGYYCTVQVSNAVFC